MGHLTFRGHDTGRFGRQVLDAACDLFGPDRFTYDTFRPADGLLDVDVTGWSADPFPARDQVWASVVGIDELVMAEVGQACRVPGAAGWWRVVDHARARCGEMGVRVDRAVAAGALPESDWCSDGRRVACRDDLAVVYGPDDTDPSCMAVITVLWRGETSRSARPAWQRPGRLSTT